MPKERHDQKMFFVLALPIFNMERVGVEHESNTARSINQKGT